MIFTNYVTFAILALSATVNAAPYKRYGRRYNFEVRQADVATIQTIVPSATASGASGVAFPTGAPSGTFDAPQASGSGKPDGMHGHPHLSIPICGQEGSSPSGSASLELRQLATGAPSGSPGVVPSGVPSGTPSGGKGKDGHRGPPPCIPAEFAGKFSFGGFGSATGAPTGAPTGVSTGAAEETGAPNEAETGAPEETETGAPEEAEAGAPEETASAAPSGSASSATATA